MKSYKILRFYRDDRETEVIKRGLTLRQAQEHCHDESTHGDDWFDGYDVDEEEVPQDVREEVEAAGPMLLSHLHILADAYVQGGEQGLDKRMMELGVDLSKVMTPAQSVGLYVAALAIAVRAEIGGES